MFLSLIARVKDHFSHKMCFTRTMAGLCTCICFGYVTRLVLASPQSSFFFDPPNPPLFSGFPLYCWKICCLKGIGYCINYYIVIWKMFNCCVFSCFSCKWIGYPLGFTNWCYLKSTGTVIAELFCYARTVCMFYLNLHVEE